jgi:hypothetical protein
VEEFLVRSVEQLLSWLSGPLWFRFILQPVVAAMLAIHAGLTDAAAKVLWPHGAVPRNAVCCSAAP